MLHDIVTLTYSTWHGSAMGISYFILCLSRGAHAVQCHFSVGCVDNALRMKPLQTGAAGHIFGVVWNPAVTIDVFNFSISILHEFSGDWCNFPVLKTFPL